MLADLRCLAVQRNISAIDDFPIRDAGTVPYYVDSARGALAINAADESHRNTLAQAETTFNGVSGRYDITLVGLAELDGEALYRLLVNSKVIGEVRNPTVSIDYMPIAHKFEDVDLTAGDVLAVGSVANSNDKIPEGEGFAFARGRWSELRLVPDGEIDVQADKVSLIINMSTLNTSVNVDEEVMIDYAIINETQLGATATGVAVLFQIPTTLSVVDASGCIEKDSFEPDLVSLSCNTTEIAPGAFAAGQLALRAVKAGASASLYATASANESEIDGTDNRASVRIAVLNSAVTPDVVTPDDNTMTPRGRYERINHRYRLAIVSGIVSIPRELHQKFI